MLNRRQVLQRDPPYDFVAALRRIRELRQEWGTSDLCFVLVIARSTLWGIEGRGSRPNADDGDAIRKLLKQCEDEDSAAKRLLEAATSTGAGHQTFDSAAGCRIRGTYPQNFAASFSRGG